MAEIKLIMNVRDAASHVESCIRSAAPLISSWFIIDTGSVDQTPQLVRKLMRELGIPGKLIKRPWVNHKVNRSELLKYAKEAGGADYCLMLDADMELVQEGELPELTAGAYMIDIRDRGMVYPLPLLTSTKYDWYYEGVAHSYLACHDADPDQDRLRELALIDHGGGPGTNDKFNRDREALSAEVAKNPLDRRSWFYLAQTYRDLDMVEEAIACYKMRASLLGWDEEVYNSLYQAGILLSEYVDAREGMTLLLEAWKYRPGRAESLRALSNVAANVADKIPYPKDDVLFVRGSAYSNALPSPPSGLTADRVSAVIVTRGNVDLQPILDTLPFEDVVVWDNSKRDRDLMIYGRYEALKEVKNTIVYWQDDDIIFTRFDELLAAYEPGKLLSNMDEAWIQGAGYRDLLALVGAGSLCDVDLPEKIFAPYLEKYPFDEDFLLECDFVFGSLVPFKRVDLGYGVREFSDDPDRLYLQPGQTERKWNMIKRAKELA